MVYIDGMFYFYYLKTSSGLIAIGHYLDKSKFIEEQSDWFLLKQFIFQSVLGGNLEF